MAPLVRRSWAPRGQTRVLYQGTRSHKKVSAVAASGISSRSALRVYFRLFADKAVNTDITIAFLRTHVRQIHGLVVLIWERLHAHISLRTRQFIKIHHQRLRVYLLPPYAPELNPVEQPWEYHKTNPMANHPIHDTATLAAETRKHARSLQRRRELLRSFPNHTPLSFLLKSDIHYTGVNSHGYEAHAAWGQAGVARAEALRCESRVRNPHN